MKDVREFFGQPSVSGALIPGYFNAPAFRKWRVTIEPVEEPVEVLRQRLVDIYQRCEAPRPNHHHSSEWRRLAQEYGLVIDRSQSSCRLATDAEWAEMRRVEEAEVTVRREAQRSRLLKRSRKKTKRGV